MYDNLQEDSLKDELFDKNINVINDTKDNYSNVKEQWIDELKKLNKIEERKKFEVLTDNFSYWISSEDFNTFQRILGNDCLQNFGFVNEIMFSSEYVRVSFKFINYVQENTIYDPVYVLLMTREREIYDEQIKLGSVYKSGGLTEEELGRSR